MTMPSKFSWTFPGKNIIFPKIEAFTVGILAVIVFLLTFFRIESLFFSIIFTILFLGVYYIISYIIQLIRMVEENYHITPTHFKAIRKTRFKTKKEKVHLKRIKFHKLDKFFLNGYMIGDKYKHLIFFNTKNELEKFEKILLKHIKKKIS